eukprot:4068414-Prymnesium_polylepis.1
MPGFRKVADFPTSPTSDFFRDLAHAHSGKRLPVADCRRLGLPNSFFACAASRSLRARPLAPAHGLSVSDTRAGRSRTAVVPLES